MGRSKLADKALDSKDVGLIAYTLHRLPVKDC